MTEDLPGRIPPEEQPLRWLLLPNATRLAKGWVIFKKETGHLKDCWTTSCGHVEQYHLLAV